MGTAPFALGTFSAAGGPPFAGVVIAEQVIAIEALGLPGARQGISVLELLENWDSNFAALQAAVAQAGELPRTPIAQLRVLPPVNLPRQVFCSGANYFKHVVDLVVDSGPGGSPGTEGMSDPKVLRAFVEDMMHKRRETGAPYMFTKPVSAVSGAFDPIALPPNAKKPDWELELGVVIGTSARHVKRADAMKHVAGYVIVNDVSDRVHLWRKDEVKAMGTDWVAGKCAPGYLPTGPYFVPAAFVPNPMDLQLTLKLNGQVMQNESSSDMLFDIARQIEYLSSLVQLWPGDLLCTGSPSGNGTHYNRFLTPGDVVESTITGLGVQRNTVIAERV